MQERSHQTVTLVRAGEAVDLWPLIEAAQYGHVFAHDDPGSDAEQLALDRFAADFSEVTEAWEETPPECQKSLLCSLEPDLSNLRGNGLHVYYGIVRRRLISTHGEAVTLPVAIINVGHCERPELMASVPTELVVC